MSKKIFSHFILVAFFLVAYNTTHAQNTYGKSIMADFSVSPSGAMTYQIPLETPSYVLGHFPNLGLAYNSHSGDGIAGWGWSISGLSSISRAPSTMHHDGFIDPVDFDADDRFVLDGQRLILKSGTYGAPESVYETENSSNLKIVAFETSKYGATYGPKYFIVYYPNGLRFWYGAYLKDTSSHSKLEWSLHRITDTQNNTVTFSYTNINESLRLNSVNDPAAKVKVTFEYDTKKQVNPIGIGGQFFTNNRLLTDIKVKVNNTITYYHYNLKHGKTSYGVDRVSSIKQKNRSGQELPELKFNYFDPTANDITSLPQTNLSYQIGDNSESSLISGDFNGDEKIDFIGFSNDRDENQTSDLVYSQGTGTSFSRNIIKVDKFEKLFVSNYLTSEGKFSNNQGIILLRHVPGSNKAVFEINKIEQVSNTILKPEYTIDWNVPIRFDKGKKLTNTKTITTAIGPSTQEKYHTAHTINANNTVSTGGQSVGYFANNSILLKSGFTATAGTTFTAKIDPNQKSGNQHDINYISGDFNGDGITDILAINKNVQETNTDNCVGLDSGRPIETCPPPQTVNSGSKAYLIDLNPNTNRNNSIVIGELLDAEKINQKFYTGDYDGDGKTDLFHHAHDKIHIYSLNKNNRLVFKTTITNTNFKTDNTILPGDYNGDGKTDFLFSQGDGNSTWGFYISNGTGFVYHSKNIGIDYRKNKVENYHDYRSPIDGYAQSSLEYFYIPVDYNKDGKTDLIKHTLINPLEKGVNKTYSVQWIDYATNQSIASNYLSFSSKRISEKYNEGIIGKGHPVFADFSKSNLMGEYAYVTYDGKINIYRYNGFHRAEVCIRSAENNGLTQRFEYDGMVPSDLGVLFTNTYSDNFSKSYTYPYTEIRRANDFKLLKKVTETFSGHTRSKEFKYAGLVSSANGLGMLGFNYMASSSWSATNVNRFWTVTQYNPELRGAVEKSWTTNTSLYEARNYPTRNFISKTSNTYNYSLKASKSYSLTTKNTVSENGLTGVKTITNYKYNEYNTPNSVVSTYPGGSKTVSSTYYDNPSGTGANYYIGRPKTKTTTTKLGSESFSTEEAYTYQNNFIKTLKTKGNNTDWLTETYEHDTYGNIVKKTISGAGITNRVEESKYYPGGRLMEWSLDVEGLKTTYKYDTSHLGHLKEEINPFGKAQKFKYDSWNRLIQTTDYLDNTTTTAYTGLSDGGLKITTSSTLGGGSETYTNRLGWETVQKTRNVLNQWVSVKKEYDATGKTYRESQPYFGANPSQWTTQSYDDYNRPKSQTLYNGITVTTTYKEKSLEVSVNDQTKTITTTKDAVGNVVRLTDPGGTITYSYYANNTPKTTNYEGHIVTTKIDGWGRKKELNDPAAGKYTYTYNILGQIKTETTPKGTNTYTYDAVGKLLKKTIVGDLTDLELNYSYESNSKLIEKIDGSDKLKNKSYTYTYAYDKDHNYRPKGITETTTEASYARLINYDVKGRVDKETYTSRSLVSGQESSVRIKSHFHPQSGDVYKYTDDTSNTLLWEIKKMNHRGQLTETKTGNNILNKATYDPYGLPTNFKDQEDKTGGRVAMDIDFDFDEKRGNLMSRHNKAFRGSESFEYDTLDRLKTISGAITHSKTYDPRGRIDINSSVGTYNYDTNSTYRTKEIELNSNGTSFYETHSVQQISYNAFKKPVTIYEKDHGRVDFEYGPMMNRSVAYYGGLDTDKSKRTYTKSYSAIIPAEIIYNTSDKSTKILTYIGGDAYSAGIVHVKKNGPNASNAYNYLHRDHLGSILAITNSSGTVIEQTHFGAWGTIEQYKKNGQNATFGYNTLLGRGYTGHEHFVSVGLIHMNGRMYDANLGRFLSPDNFIQDPYNTQSFNRYGYVWNNPLKYGDPSGEFLVTALIIGAVVGAYLGGAQANGTLNPFKWDYQNGATWGGILGGAAIGGISGVAGAYVGAAALSASGVTGGVLGGVISGAAGGLVGGAISGFGTSLLPGGSGKPLDGLWKGAATGLIGGAIIGGTIGGVQSAVKGNNIWNGEAVTKSVTSAPSSKANGLKTASENLDETLNTKTSSTKIAENSGITKSSGEAARQQINNAIPREGPINYKTSYLEKVNGIDGTHNWNRTSIEIVADKGVVFPNSVGADGTKQVLIQHHGLKQGTKGVFELIIRDNAIHHQRFIPNGIINGVPNQSVPRLPSGTLNPPKWWK